MGDPRAFLNIPRQEAGYRPVNERITDYSQVEQTLNTNSRKLQASRCMDCGVPFCHWACPIGNKQPEMERGIRNPIVHLWLSWIYGAYLSSPLWEVLCTKTFMWPTCDDSRKRSGYRWSSFSWRIYTNTDPGKKRKESSGYWCRSCRTGRGQSTQSKRIFSNLIW